MRAFLTTIFIIVLAVLTCALTLADGVARSLANPDSVMRAVDASEVRDAVVDLGEELLAREVARNPQLSGVTRPEMHAVVDDVLAKEWFDAKVRDGYVALETAVAAAPATAIVDLRPLKTSLRLAIAELHQRADQTCVRLAGQAECSGSRPASRSIQGYADRARLVVDSADDKVDLTEVVAREDQREEARRWMSNAPQLRWIGLGVLGVVLVLILLVNLGYTRRVLVGLGAALAVSAAFSFGVQLAAASRARAEIEKRIATAHEWQEIDPAIARIAPPAIARLAGAIVDEAVIAAHLPLIIMGIAGGVLLVSALAARRREE